MNIYWQIFGHLLFVGGSILSLYCLWILWARWSYKKAKKDSEKY